MSVFYSIYFNSKIIYVSKELNCVWFFNFVKFTDGCICSVWIPCLYHKFNFARMNYDAPVNNILILISLSIRFLVLP